MKCYCFAYAGDAASMTVAISSGDQLTCHRSTRTRGTVTLGESTPSRGDNASALCHKFVKVLPAATRCGGGDTLRG